MEKIKSRWVVVLLALVRVVSVAGLPQPFEQPRGQLGERYFVDVRRDFPMIFIPARVNRRRSNYIAAVAPDIESKAQRCASAVVDRVTWMLEVLMEPAAAG